MMEAKGVIARCRRTQRIKKVLVIGSGPIVIGQAAEFDYAGTQACRALKAEGLEVVLVNSNPATIMTDTDMADKVYIEPLTADGRASASSKRKSPTAILPTLGGQTGLNLCHGAGPATAFWTSSGVRLLGAKPETIDKRRGPPAVQGYHGEASDQPGHPLQGRDRPGRRAGLCRGHRLPRHRAPRLYPGRHRRRHLRRPRKNCRRSPTNGLRLSPIHQILVEKCISGWKEIEFEVMRDCNGQRHHRLLHGKLGPRRRPHRRLHRRGPQP